MRPPRLSATVLTAYVAVPAALAWSVAAHVFPVAGPLAWLDPLLFLGALVLTAAALRFWASPIHAGFTPGKQGRDEPRERLAAAAALAFPARVAWSLTLVGLVLLAVAVSARVAAGTPADLALAVAVAGVGAVAGLALLGHSAAAVAVVPSLSALAPAELRRRENVGARVVTFCLGLVTAAALVLTALGYARYREDTDREYVGSAQQALERAALTLGTREAAELMRSALAAPTAALSVDGTTVLQQSGPIEGRLLRDLPPAAAGAQAVPGGWRIWTAGPGVRLVSQLSDAGLRPRRRAYGVAGFWNCAVLILAAALVVALAARSVVVAVRQLGGAAARIAGGDLTVRPPSTSRDELGWLSADFRRMAQGLSSLVKDVRAASQAVEEGTLPLGAIGARVRGSAEDEQAGLSALQASVEAMQGSVAQVTAGVAALGEHVHSTSAALGDLAAALHLVRRQAGDLEGRMAETGDDVQRLADTGKRAQAQLTALGGHVDGARTTLSRVSASLSGLETSAIGGQLAAAQAAEIAERAGAVVQESVGGIEKVRSAVADAKKRVTLLGRRSDDIDHILDFVGEVAGRTNLLSLNASIIATQAGEHGKPFAVVADQVHELAAQISSSTKSIAEIIRAVRDDVAGTARLIDRGDALATEGVAAALKSADALKEMRAATSKTHESAAAILEAVQVHALSTREVATLVAAVAEGTKALSEAMQMIGRSVTAVGAVSRSVGGLADGVSRALEEQSGLGQQQLESLVAIDGRLSEISRAVEAHGSATRSVRESIAVLRRTAAGQAVTVTELATLGDRLSSRTRALAERVGRFKVEG